MDFRRCAQMLPFNTLFSRATPTAVNIILISFAISRLHSTCGYMYVFKS